MSGIFAEINEKACSSTLPLQGKGRLPEEEHSCWVLVCRNFALKESGLSSGQACIAAVCGSYGLVLSPTYPGS